MEGDDERPDADVLATIRLHLNGSGTEAIRGIVRLRHADGRVEAVLPRIQGSELLGGPVHEIEPGMEHVAVMAVPDALHGLDEVAVVVDLADAPLVCREPEPPEVGERWLLIPRPEIGPDHVAALHDGKRSVLDVEPH